MCIVVTCVVMGQLFGFSLAEFSQHYQGDNDTCLVEDAAGGCENNLKGAQKTNTALRAAVSVQ